MTKTIRNTIPIENSEAREWTDYLNTLSKEFSTSDLERDFSYTEYDGKLIRGRQYRVTHGWLGNGRDFLNSFRLDLKTGIAKTEVGGASFARSACERIKRDRKISIKKIVVD